MSMHLKAMTRDDVIRAAGEAGFHFHDAGFAPTLHTVPLEYSEKCFERFAALIEAAATEKANVAYRVVQS